MATTIITIPSQGRTSQKEEEYKPHKTTKKEQPVGGGYIKWNQLVLLPACCRLFFVFRVTAESRRALGATLCTGQDHSASTAFSHWFIGNGQRDKARGWRAQAQLADSRRPTAVSLERPTRRGFARDWRLVGEKKEKKKQLKIRTQS